MYTQGRFFTPNLRAWRGGGSRINVEKRVVGCAGLRGMKSEKGDLTGWGVSSVFGAITDRSKVFRDAGWVSELLVCNDVGASEIADLFGLHEKSKKVVMIDAKKARAFRTREKLPRFTLQKLPTTSAGPGLGVALHDGTRAPLPVGKS